MTNASSPIRVAVVDDDPMIGQAMRLILGDYSHGDISVTAVCVSGEQALASAREQDIDVALVDIAMPELDGIATTRALRALPHAPHILILTSLGTSGNVERAIEAGAEGFISKTDAPEDIIRRIRGVCAGDPQFNPASQRQLITELFDQQPRSRRQEARDLLNALPEREREAVLLAAQGYTNAQIAQHMFISERTAKAHLAAASERLCMNRIHMARLVERAALDENEWL